MTGLDIMRAACADPFAAARAAKAAGQRVIAYAGVSVPVELIRASGAFALQLAGDPSHPTPLSDTYLDDEFDGEIRSLFDQIGSGACNVAEIIIIPRASNGLLYLYYSLLELQKLEPQLSFPELVLFDVLNTPNWETGQYVLDRCCALHATLGGSARALRDAVAVGNQVREGLHVLNQRRRAGALRGSSWWAALRASRVMAPADWLAAAGGIAQESAPSKRLMLKGYCQDTPALYLMAEELGASVVAEDCIGGERTVAVPVDEGAEPLAALADHYQRHVPTIRSYPQAREDAAWVALVEASATQGVVFYHEEFDDTFGWDYPAQKAQLQLPHALLTRQSYRAPDRPAQRAALAELIGRIEA